MSRDWWIQAWFLLGGLTVLVAVTALLVFAGPMPLLAGIFLWVFLLVVGASTVKMMLEAKNWK